MCTLNFLKVIVALILKGCFRSIKGICYLYLFSYLYPLSLEQTSAVGLSVYDNTLGFISDRERDVTRGKSIRSWD